MTFLDILGYGGAVLGVAMLAMRTMVPLRLTGIANNLVSMTYGLLAGVWPMALQHAVLLPVNLYRLREMMQLVRGAKAASMGDHTMEWLTPYMTKRDMRNGEILFRKGEEADRMFLVVSGRCRLPEIGVDVPPGTMVGELAMLAPDLRRTQTLACIADGALLEISYDRFKQIYFQNPSFGLHFVQLISARLFDNISRLEEDLAAQNRELGACRTEIVRLRQRPVG